MRRQGRLGGLKFVSIRSSFSTSYAIDSSPAPRRSEKRWSSRQDVALERLKIGRTRSKPPGCAHQRQATRNLSAKLRCCSTSPIRSPSSDSSAAFSSGPRAMVTAFVGRREIGRRRRVLLWAGRRDIWLGILGRHREAESGAGRGGGAQRRQRGHCDEDRSLAMPSIYTESRSDATGAARADEPSALAFAPACCFSIHNFPQPTSTQPSPPPSQTRPAPAVSTPSAVLVACASARSACPPRARRPR